MRHTFDETVYLLCGCIYITLEETFLILMHKKPREKSNCVFLIAILIAMRLPNNVEMDMLEAKENSKLSFHCCLPTYQSESVHIERRPMPLSLPASSRVFLKRRLMFRQQFLSTPRDFLYMNVENASRFSDPSCRLEPAVKRQVGTSHP